MAVARAGAAVCTARNYSHLVTLFSLGWPPAGLVTKDREQSGKIYSPERVDLSGQRAHVISLSKKKENCYLPIAHLSAR